MGKRSGLPEEASTIELKATGLAASLPDNACSSLQPWCSRHGLVVFSERWRLPLSGCCCRATNYTYKQRLSSGWTCVTWSKPLQRWRLHRATRYPKHAHRTALCLFKLNSMHSVRGLHMLSCACLACEPAWHSQCPSAPHGVLHLLRDACSSGAAQQALQHGPCTGEAEAAVLQVAAGPGCIPYRVVPRCHFRQF
jgi:hypothetical protein